MAKAVDKLSDAQKDCNMILRIYSYELVMTGDSLKASGCFVGLGQDGFPAGDAVPRCP